MEQVVKSYIMRHIEIQNKIDLQENIHDKFHEYVKIRFYILHQQLKPMVSKLMVDMMISSSHSFKLLQCDN